MKSGVQNHVVSRPLAMRSARGFSLLELMLVLAIIGILIAAATVNLAGTNTQARIQVAKTSMSTIKGALGRYNLQHSSYPATLDVLIAQKFLEDKKMADPWGRTWVYDPRGVNRDQPYILGSYGEDGIAGNEDDLNVWTIDK